MSFLARTTALLVTLAALLCVSGLPALAAEPPAPVEKCRFTDKRLKELSGLASDGKRWYAMADGGSKLQVLVLTPACKVERVISNPTDPFDVEDLARAADGTLWLADTGDNGKKRDSVALHALTPNGKATLYRLTYPDGPHDAEALLLDRKGTPYIVTKEPFAAAGIYRPGKALTAPGPTPLEKVGTIRIRSSSTPGGPVAGFGSVLVTGGAVSHDGTVVALRTYTDALLFPAPDGDIAEALKREPVRVPLPNETQGEAIAFEPDGTLLSGSEEMDPIRAIPGAAALAASAAPAGNQASKTPAPNGGGNQASGQPAEAEGSTSWGGILLAGVGVLAVILLVGRSRRAKR
ncbi:hypothetical protein GCM10010452_29640 [Crossiella cryophila]|uniref:Esterase-like activity of phytase family protein n=1 Tax=Crossiella cryophila TaxID=43355 RepID=A0A7W7FVF0_9PSEU|nr:hypothetical protein [Crossiella cryophila]